MKSVMHDIGRRQFLKRSAWLSTLPLGGSLLAAAVAGAQSAGDYKALVCIDLSGGNDQSNTVVPLSNSGYASYRTARDTLALDRSVLLPLNPVGYSGEQVGLHPSLAKLKPLFDSGRIAMLANVGTLAAPITKAQVDAGTASLPLQLGSHSDQMHAWQSGVPDSPVSTGWMGRIGDLTAEAFNPDSRVSIAMSLAGSNTLQAGRDVIQYQLSNDGAIRINALENLYGSDAGSVAARQLMTDPRSHLFENELTAIRSRSINSEGVVRAALSSSAGTLPLVDPFPKTRIGQQLKMVARMISVRSAVSQRRQLFYVNQGSYDHHDNVNGTNAESHPALLRDLANAMDAFNTTMNALQIAQNVTTFTVSEFGRTLQSNGRGSDHGWGGHHFIMGGAVLGNRIYGRFPTVALDGPEDYRQGALMPTTAVDEYASTLARWFGVSATDMSTVLPNIERFSNRNLGFLG